MRVGPKGLCDLGGDEFFVERLEFIVGDLEDPVFGVHHVVVDDVVEDCDLSFLVEASAEEGVEVVLPLGRNLLSVLDDVFDVVDELGAGRKIDSVRVAFFVQAHRLLDVCPVIENLLSSEVLLARGAVFVERSELDSERTFDVARSDADDELAFEFAAL